MATPEVCGKDGSVACRAQLWGRGHRLRHTRRHSSWHICRCTDEETWEKAQEATVHRTSRPKRNSKVVYMLQHLVRFAPSVKVITLPIVGVLPSVRGIAP